MEMKKVTFGVEIEFSGMPRAKATEILAKTIGGELDGSRWEHGLEVFTVTAPDGRKWKIASDSSIRAVDENGNRAGSSYQCELVTPPLRYDRDMETLQEIVRALRKAGGSVSDSEGLHIHVNGGEHDAKSLKNLIGLMYARGELFGRALEVPDSRRERWCRNFEENFVEKARKTKTMEALQDLWYDEFAPYDDRHAHYNNSRYHALNLHSFWGSPHHTVEFRLFNSTLHAGKVRAYVLLALAINWQALTAKSVSIKKPQNDNDKYAMRTYLLRLGFIGDEFAAPREHLLAALSGNSAWR